MVRMTRMMGRTRMIAVIAVTFIATDTITMNMMIMITVTSR